MRKELGKISLGIVLAGTLVSFTLIKEKNSTRNKRSPIAQISNVSETFIISNSKSVSLPIETIDKLHKFQANAEGGGFRCVTTGAADATDVGAYSELYFLFDNSYEMPHRRAIFKIGNLAEINSFKKISNSKYEIKGFMFENNKFIIDEEVIITIDASDVIKQENKYDKDNSGFEGDVSSKIVVSVESE